MDVFSDVIATVRAGRAKFTRSRLSGRWGYAFGPYPGAGFHVVLEGSCWLIPPVRLPCGARRGRCGVPAARRRPRHERQS